MTRLVFLPLVLALSACASPAPTRFETPLSERIPSSLLTCRDRPAVEGSLERQSDVARWIVELDAAGADCRSKVAAMKDVVEGDAQGDQDAR